MPRKLPPGEGKRHPLNMRTTRDLRENLEAAAAASGRSLCQEVEFRLERSFQEAAVSDDRFRAIIREEIAAERELWAPKLQRERSPEVPLPGLVRQYFEGMPFDRLTALGQEELLADLRRLGLPLPDAANDRRSEALNKLGLASYYGRALSHLNGEPKDAA